MNQLCKVCDEPAAGYHFGAFTCEGCKSFFGRTYNNLSQVHECKNGGACVINKQNRTSCKACRLKKCLVVGMSKSGSRYGRRSNWFKIHCLLQEQAANLNKSIENRANVPMSLPDTPTSLSNLTKGRTTEEIKAETPVLSSPESINSDNSIDVARRGLSSLKDLSRDIDPETRIQEDGSPRDLIANWGLYSLNPSLSLLQASQFYSRLYPSMLYSNLAHPQLMIPPNSNRSSPPYSWTAPSRTPPQVPVSPVSLKAEHRSPSVYSGSPETSPRHAPPTPPISLFENNPLRAPTFLPRKREAESPLDDLRKYQGSPSDDGQDAPIDLRIKRRRISAHPPQDPATPPRSPDFPRIPLPVIPATITPVDLTTSA